MKASQANYLARIYVYLKETVNDPEGTTILGGLKALGFAEVENVRSGKYIELTINAADEKSAEVLVTEMCDKVLANTIIENYRFELNLISNVEDSP